jgi:hypothetical protein
MDMNFVLTQIKLFSQVLRVKWLFLNTLKLLNFYRIKINAMRASVLEALFNLKHKKTLNKLYGGGGVVAC